MPPFECRLGATDPKWCMDRQLNHRRYYSNGKVCAMFTCCLKPTCPHWLSDEYYDEHKNALKCKKPWAYNGTRRAART